MQTSTTKSTYWCEHIAQLQLSGLSQKAYCALHDLKPYLLTYWKRKFTGRSVLPEPSSGFIPVSLAPDIAMSGLYIVLPNGIRVGGLSSVESAAHLLQALK